MDEVYDAPDFYQWCAVAILEGWTQLAYEQEKVEQEVPKTLAELFRGYQHAGLQNHR